MPLWYKHWRGGIYHPFHPIYFFHSVYLYKEFLSISDLYFLNIVLYIFTTMEFPKMHPCGTKARPLIVC